MKKPILVAAIALLVFVSGCTQVNTISDSFKKVKALEQGPGYSADYVMNFKIALNDKLKAAAAKDPQTAAGLGKLENIPDINLKISGAKKAGQQKSSIDTSGLQGITGQTGAEIPFKTLSFYQNGNEATICLEIKGDTLCTKGTKDDLAKKIPNIASQLSAADQFSSQSPDKMLEQFKNLYDKGALTLGPSGKDTVIGRQCDQISYTVGDLSKLNSKELLAALGPFGSQLTGATGADETQLTQASFLLKQIVKEIKQEFCLDSEYGLPLTSTYSINIDISALEKIFASATGGAGTQQIPDGAGFTIKFTTTATSVKSPVTDTDFALPPNAKLESVDSLLAKAPQLKVGLSGASSAVSTGPPSYCTGLNVGTLPEYQKQGSQWPSWTAQSEGECQILPNADQNEIAQKCWQTDTAALSAGTGGGANSVDICWYGYKSASSTLSSNPPTGCSPIGAWTASLGNYINQKEWDSRAALYGGAPCEISRIPTSADGCNAVLQAGDKYLCWYTNRA